MCGRYLLTTPLEALRRAFAFEGSANLPPRWNVAPTQEVACVRLEDGPDGLRRRRLALMRWGLVPRWSKALAGPPLINARSETMATKPAFREAVRERRCLVLADGFYEWDTRTGDKAPWLFRLPSGEPFAFAGLWERWRSPEGRTVESVAIVSRAAGPLMERFHDRMPAILDPADHDAWLGPDPAVAVAAVRPGFGERLVPVQVSTRVNRVRNDDPECIRPLADERPAGDAAQGVLL